MLSAYDKQLATDPRWERGEEAEQDEPDDVERDDETA
jgi:hypothetical protein